MCNYVSSRLTKKLAVIAITLLFATNCFAQAVEKVIFSFSGGVDGSQPAANLVQDSKGNLYGTTSSGGEDDYGTLFELSKNSDGSWTEQTIHSFGAEEYDGMFPVAGLVMDGKGNLYGSTIEGGIFEDGVIFEFTPGSGGTWVETIIYNFTAENEGAQVYAPLVLDGVGNLYGTTLGGGVNGNGTAFELITGSNGVWAEKTLYNFTGGNDGGSPYHAPLTFDSAGNLYGVAASGGAHDYGAIFELSPNSNGTWTEKIVHAFSGGAGDIGGQCGVIFDAAGNIYLEAVYALLELSPGSDGTWTVKNLHNFAGGSDGADANGGLTFDKAGNLYGTTAYGGLHQGTVFEMTPNSNGTWTEKILHKFTGGSDGQFPFSTLTVGNNGVVYGTTLFGGASNFGVAFEIQP
ncbi:MAG: choice-of-anchor tandem repeat GloVer-containing protein [Candidatus Sulfotelmatobacter sp.]|jgi:uncharacterized repeat protein (TIGR03803 family)